jgi:PhoPQ-activated pathogenicity-related protein
VAVLLNVPQQPIFDGMVEDQIISYTFEQFIKTKDDSWPLLLPMVKSAVRGMDAVQELAKQQGLEPIERFMVTGASKRGWTTWLTAAIDPRVGGLAPMVIDMLNMQTQLDHQVSTFGKFSDQIHDYTERGIPQLMKTPQGKLLTAIVDPYTYRDRIAQPKLIMLGTNDRYWPLDALNLYWDGLKGEKFVLYVPNQGHGLADYGRVLGTVAAFQRHVSGEAKLPVLAWNHQTTGDRHQLTFSSSQKPTQVLAWTAEATSRDFRDAKWTSQVIEANEGMYRAEIEVPSTGYRAILIEGQYGGGTLPYYLSTTLQIIGK